VTFPFAKSVDEAGVGLDAGTLTFGETDGAVKGHAIVADEVCDDDSWTP
jgi:hypothetical protein